ncbi:MAG: hypothetical protein ACPLRW_05650 [Moorellales bacterium]
MIEGIGCRVVTGCPECGSANVAVRRVNYYYSGYRFLPGGGVDWDSEEWAGAIDGDGALFLVCEDCGAETNVSWDDELQKLVVFE